MSDGILRPYIGHCDFNVGTLFAHDGYALMLHDACTQAGVPYPIDYVFGSVDCALQGGRAAPLEFNEATVEEIFNRYAQIGVGVRLTFSRYDVDEQMLEDQASNYMLGLLNQGNNNGVIISSDLLAGYIRENYPNLQLVCSLVKPTVENTLGQEAPEYYNRLAQDYDVVVLNSAWAFDDDYLARIEQPGKMELIVNHRCRPNCPLSKDHYTTQTNAARATATGNFMMQRRLEGRLKQINQECHRRRAENPLVNSLINAQRVQELVDMGFVHFKLEGRDYPLFTMVHDIGTWLFQPDGIYPSMAQSLLQNPV